ncbi:hypothetical protein XELAEV_18044820mg [Xenopus laevis]|uniref:Uncharacterized protein n=1 Tax=Xenopus laevis TaxID=8355 RepID=A0A974C044_XENLA|nr:hypothetical protein XELAEV_18044820mg [Xenopus laevis]
MGKFVPFRQKIYKTQLLIPTTIDKKVNGRQFLSRVGTVAGKFSQQICVLVEGETQKFAAHSPITRFILNKLVQFKVALGKDKRWGR